MSGSHKKRMRAPEMVVGRTASVASTRSEDDCRHRTTIGVVGANAGPSTVSNQSGFWAEDLAANEARMQHDFTYILSDNSVESQLDQEFNNGTWLEDGITVVINGAAPRYHNSVCCLWLLDTLHK
jgi:hypothetical protein